MNLFQTICIPHSQPPKQPGNRIDFKHSLINYFIDRFLKK
ncbi:hypothetical protein ANACOL_01568 [Anaerotruncus colihominis DSM 17241]|uniref:Uncharacterized protein n=1 Tax=Anaerotruncus colihominis DSM 17241 TaxID=445972 RepID=B0PA00_9FIRM|nr:hypothetical protein ANACOL_01568 [Anaerotruncus colihominis DSM 17241]